MKQKALSEEAAYRLLRKMAMDENIKLVEVAEQVIRAAKLLL
jgi:response regulator NasT